MKISASVKHDGGTTKHYIGSMISDQNQIIHGVEVTAPPVRLEIVEEWGAILLFGYDRNDDWLWDMWFDSEESAKEFATNEYGVDYSDWVSVS